MITETDYLKSISEEIALNYSISKKAPKADHHLLNEAKRCEKSIIHNLTILENPTQRDTLLFNTLHKLVNICDILFDIDQSVTPDVTTILELLSTVRQVVPNGLRPTIKLPKALIILQRTTINEYWALQEERIRKHDIDEKLIDIAAIPFRRFTEPKDTLYWGDFTWLKGYQAKLD